MRAVSSSPPARHSRLAAKRAALAKGRAAEEAAVAFLRVQGYEILWQNLRLGRDELDVVVRRGDVLVVVEVRHRGEGAFTGGFASVDHVKQKHLLRATRALLRGPARTLSGLTRCRIDVLDVLLGPEGPEVRHAEAAVTA